MRIKIDQEMDTSDIDNLFDRIGKWNKLRDNLDYNDRTELRMLTEELLEFALLENKDAKEWSEILSENLANKIKVSEFSIEEVDAKIDAVGDILFVAIGTLFKLGASPEGVLRKICDHNDQKGSKKDAGGKIIKDRSVFIEPIHIKE